MPEVLKRLEIIQNAIALGDEDIIALQAKRLPDSAAELAGLLAAKEYAAATVWMENYRQQNLSVAKYKDPELTALQLELESLERQLTELDSEKSELERQIGEFNSAYMENCGEELGQLLQARMQQQQKHAEESPAKEADEELEKTQRDYEEFRRQKQKPPLQHLNDEDKKEIKSLYKRAALKCHPDKLPAAQKEKGEEMFKQLNAAYEKNDLETVRDIWQKLKSGDWTAGSATISDKVELKRRIVSLRKKTEATQKEIQTIRADEVYQTIETLAQDNVAWEDYFAKTKADLQTALAEIEAE